MKKILLCVISIILFFNVSVIAQETAWSTIGFRVLDQFIKGLPYKTKYSTMHKDFPYSWGKVSIAMAAAYKPTMDPTGIFGDDKYKFFIEAHVYDKNGQPLMVDHMRVQMRAGYTNVYYPGAPQQINNTSSISYSCRNEGPNLILGGIHVKRYEQPEFWINSDMGLKLSVGN